MMSGWDNFSNSEKNDMLQASMEKMASLEAENAALWRAVRASRAWTAAQADDDIEPDDFAAACVEFILSNDALWEYEAKG